MRSESVRSDSEVESSSHSGGAKYQTLGPSEKVGQMYKTNGAGMTNVVITNNGQFETRYRQTNYFNLLSN